MMLLTLPLKKTGTYNRTIEELKYTTAQISATAPATYNRTIEELKSYLSACYGFIG